MANLKHTPSTVVYSGPPRKNEGVVKIAVIWDSLFCALHVFSFAMCFPLLFILSCACCVYIVRPCASVIVSRLHPLLLPALFPPHLFPIIILSVCPICPPGSCLCSSFYLSPVFLLSTVGLFRFLPVRDCITSFELCYFSPETKGLIFCSSFWNKYMNYFASWSAIESLPGESLTGVDRYPECFTNGWSETP